MQFYGSLRFLSLFVVLLVWAKEDESKDLSHGFAKDVEWIEWSKAIELSEELKKPVFLLIHKTWCGACKQLKSSFETSTKRKEFIELSRQFVMVNLEDDEEPEDDKYAPDGRYIPRLYFLKDGSPLPVDNKKNYPSNAYYFPQLHNIVEAMNKALKVYNGEVEEEKPIEKREATDSNDAKKDSKKDDKKDSKKDDKKDSKKDDKKDTDTKKSDAKKDSKKDDKKAEKKDTDAKKDPKKDDKKDPKKDDKKAEKKDTDTKKDTKKSTDKKDADAKKDTKKPDAKKTEKKKTDDKAECPHAKKAKEEKAKKEKSKSDSKSSKAGKDEKESKSKKSDAKADKKKSEL